MEPAYHITSPEQANELIADIRSAVRRSKRTGGGYGIYRRDANGRLAVTIEVCIAVAAAQPHTIKPRRSRRSRT